MAMSAAHVLQWMAVQGQKHKCLLHNAIATDCKLAFKVILVTGNFSGVHV